MDKHQIHSKKIEKLRRTFQNYIQNHPNKKVRFYHGGSNSTRTHLKKGDALDISFLNEIVEIDRDNLFALVEPNVSMASLVQSTLTYGLLPQVVMEFPAITVGGAINGAALESSSYRYGQFNDTCKEYEILTGEGRILKASPSENADLFYGVSGSYGTLGLVTLAKISLVQAMSFVELHYFPTTSQAQVINLLQQYTLQTNYDYIEAILFSQENGVVICGKQVPSAQVTSPITYTHPLDDWFYEKAEQLAKKESPTTEYVPIVDYLFRYDRGAFWMGNYAFSLIHTPKNKLTKLLFNFAAKTKRLYEGLNTLNVSQNYFAQDFYIPWTQATSFLDYNHQTIAIYPLWLCPVKATETLQKLSPHYSPDSILLDIGIWGQTKQYLQDKIGNNRAFEAFVKKLKGRKMLYAHAYYSEVEFWHIYDRSWYNALREKYRATNVFPDVWEKTHVKKVLKPRVLIGLLEFFFLQPIKRFLKRD